MARILIRKKSATRWWPVLLLLLVPLALAWWRVRTRGTATTAIVRDTGTVPPPVPLPPGAVTPPVQAPAGPSSATPGATTTTTGAARP